MRKKLLHTSIIGLCTFCLLTSNAQKPLLQTKAMLLKRIIERNHYDPKPVDDAFSAQVFDQIIKYFDEYKLYLTQADLATLSPFRNKIDDEITGKSWGFVPQLLKVYKAAITKADATGNAQLQKPFTFDTDEYFNYGDQQQSPQNEAEYQLRWTRYLKWRILSRLLDSYTFSDTVKIDKAKLMKNEPLVRKKMLDKFAKDVATQSKKPNRAEELIGNLYLQKIASTFDPHTEYFPVEEKEAFDEQLSTQSMDYGFKLEEDKDGSLKIGGLVPGGSAWKSGNMHNDDKLVQIKPEGEEAIDVKNASSEDISKILESKSNKSISVTVRSADATVKTINLQRQLQRNDDNIVKGFVLNGSKKIGYISLPSFYYETSTNGSSSCDNDVAKEIVKLKKENIEGLVLDLRYNGGGSVQEAIELSGIFIDAGPVMLVRDKDKKMVVIKDPNRGTIYDGPMAVMINGQSASASELVAGTLQDYKRAVIIGSTSFGKATMQSVLPMDSTSTNPEAPSQQTKEFGYVKTTEGKLFRITGKTAQLNGVVPDIALPDAFEAMDYTERSMPFALPSDTVMKQVYYTPLKPMAVSAAVIKSTKRISENPFFNNLDKVVAQLKAMHKETRIPLKWETYINWMKQENLTEGLIKEKKETKKAFKIINTSFDDKVMNLDSYQKEMNDYVIADLTDDQYIEEAYQVMLDLINLK